MITLLLLSFLFRLVNENDPNKKPKPRKITSNDFLFVFLSFSDLQRKQKHTEILNWTGVTTSTYWDLLLLHLLFFLLLSFLNLENFFLCWRWSLSLLFAWKVNRHFQRSLNTPPLKIWFFVRHRYRNLYAQIYIFLIWSVTDKELGEKH